MTVEIEPSPSNTQIEAPKRPRIVRWYMGSAILLFNTLILFIVINLLCWAGLAIHAARARPAYLSYSDEWYRKTYAPMPDSEWKEMVRETKVRPFGFQPYTM